MTCKLHRIKSVLFSAVVLMLAGTVAAAAGTLLGDADSDGDVTIIDATCIQRTLAELPVSGEFSRAASDVDGSGDIEITDATFIQRWLAEMDTPYLIGEWIDTPTEATEEQSTESASEAPIQRPTDEDGWGRDVFRP